MKRVISVATVVALAAVIFSSCGSEKTPEELLTYKNGWKMSKATSTPAYKNNDGVEDADLFESYFYECEQKDVLYFKSDGDGKRTVLAHGCFDDGKETTGTWEFSDSDGKLLKFRIPFFEEEKYATVDVTKLEEDVFEFTYSWTKAGTTDEYKFRITYAHAK